MPHRSSRSQKMLLDKRAKLPATCSLDPTALGLSLVPARTGGMRL